MTAAIDLKAPEVRVLIRLIKDSFRVRKNRRPVYVDVGDNLSRLDATQHQVIFGRRGSGKSCLLIEYLAIADKSNTATVYVLADEFKRLAYPDILIRLLIEILTGISRNQPWYRRFLFRNSKIACAVRDLTALLDVPLEAAVSEGRQVRDSDRTNLILDVGGVGKLTTGSASENAQQRTADYRERKLDALERHLRDFKNGLVEATEQWRFHRGSVVIDDFYLIPQAWQPDVIDYMHRLLRDTDVYLKVATIRHRSKLLRNSPNTVGVELSQDVEEIDLDRTLEDLEQTQNFLYRMLRSIGSQAGLNDVDQLFNPDALQALALASGGVPRDFLTTFVHAVEAADTDNKGRWITPKHVYKGAGRLAYQTKLKHLREDAEADAAGLERVFVDLLEFCLKEKRKTGFLVSQEEAQQHTREHELIQQLMDFKLIHIIEPDTSAASGRPGRYEAYTLDFSLFMEPRRRSIEILEFWRRGADRHRLGVRELPVYPLERAGQVFDRKATADPEAFLKADEQEAANQDLGIPTAVHSKPRQGNLPLFGEADHD